MHIDRENHFTQYIEESKFVVLRKHEFDSLSGRIGFTLHPQNIVDGKGNATHVVLLEEEYEVLISDSPDPDMIFRIEMRKGVRAEASVSTDPNEPWVYVYKGSTIGAIEDSLEPRYRELRKTLYDDGVISAYETAGVFLKDHEFKKPSVAARVVTGSPESGNVYWKDRHGNTLDDRGFGVHR